MLLVATLVFAFVSAQVAVAGPGGGAERASHGGTHAKASKIQLRNRALSFRQQIEELYRQIGVLQSQLNALSGTGGSAAPPGGIPTGAAGGDLTGSYPNPQIAADALGSTEVQDGALTQVDINPLNVDGAAGTPSLRTLGAGGQQAAAGNDPRLSDARTPTGAAGGDLAGTYPNPLIGAGSIGGPELGSVRLNAQPTPALLEDETQVIVSRSCAANEQLLSAGFEIVDATGAPASGGPDIFFDRNGPTTGDTWELRVLNPPGATGDVHIVLDLLCLEV